MLQGLNDVRWADLNHAYGSAADVPELLRKLLDADPKVHGNALWELYGNVFHQGTRYPATPYVIPFLIEMCADSAVPNRGDLLGFWGSLITGYFSIQERPWWGDGKRIYWFGEVQEVKEDDPYAAVLHQIYRESLKGHELLCRLLSSEEPAVRAGAAWVLACLPTMSAASVSKLKAQIRVEPSGWVRAAIAFAFGELGASTQLRDMLAKDEFAAVRCMAVCQLARIQPTGELIEPLLNFVVEPIDGYERIPGAGGKSTGDAAFSISYLPSDVQREAIPVICDRLAQTRSFDTLPLITTLLSAAFEQRNEPLTQLTDLQREILGRMVNMEELWSIANRMGIFRMYGLPAGREECAQLIGVKIVHDYALTELRSALMFVEIGFFERARQGIRKALEIDPAVFERAPVPEECWLLYAEAFAESDPKRSLTAFQRASRINPAIIHRINPTGHLADLLKEIGPG